MSHLIAGLFTDSKLAGEAISELKNKGYTKDISVITKDGARDTKTHDVKKDVSDGAGMGAATGAAMGAAIAGLTALLVGAVTVAIPGVGIVIAGPLAAGLAGAATGAVAGGVVGALVDAGFPEEKAKMYQHEIENGETLVSVSAGADKSGEVESILKKYGAHDTEVLNEKN